LFCALQRQGPFDLVYERYSLWSHAGMDYAQAVGIPGLLEVNAPLIKEQARHRVLVDQGKAEWVAHRAIGNASSLVAVSDEVASHLGQYPLTDGRVHVIPNGVDPDRFPEGLRSVLGGTSGTFMVGFVGTLKPWHGLSTLVGAFERLHDVARDAQLLIVGDGPERSALEEDLSRRGLRQAVQFTGAVDPTQIPGLIAAMDAAVAPYPNLTDFYFSPLKVYEYMAAGRAVVASRIGQLNRLVEHEITGLLTSPGDPADLAGALMRLRTEPELRQRLGKTARAKIQREHTWKATVRRILDLAVPAMPTDFASTSGA
jgi:glycosyltransferase involved in cell wall biosynthesis